MSNRSTLCQFVRDYFRNDVGEWFQNDPLCVKLFCVYAHVCAFTRGVFGARVTTCVGFLFVFVFCLGRSFMFNRVYRVRFTIVCSACVLCVLMCV